MHEMSTCKKLINQIEEVAGSQQGKSVKSVTLSIGALARVDVDELIELFPFASHGTCAENANLLIEREPIFIKCISCNRESSVSASDMSCPICRSEQTQLLSGTDMLLKELEFA